MNVFYLNLCRANGIMQQLSTRDEIEKIVGFRIRNLGLYQESFIHKSAVKLYNVARSNERMEFIGDSVLNLVIAKYLYEKYPNEDEGYMTKMRTRIVSGQCLSRIAEKMHLSKHVRMNEKALRQGWNMNPRILEDVFESLIGAIYLDQGLDMSSKFILDKLNTHIDTEDLHVDRNFKDILMRHTQIVNTSLPVYKIELEFGPNHKKYFIVNVKTNDFIIGKGMALNKKQAEQKAAFNALSCVGLIEN